MVWFYLINNSFFPKSCGSTNCAHGNNTDKILNATMLYLKQFALDNTHLSNHSLETYLHAYKTCALFVNKDAIGNGSQDPSGETFNEGKVEIKLSNIHGDLLPTMCTLGDTTHIMKLCLKDSEVANVKVRFKQGDTTLHSPFDLFLQLKKGFKLKFESCDSTKTHIISIYQYKGGSHLRALYLKYSKM